MEGKKVIVRTGKADVFYGTLASREGGEVTLHNARRIWYWSGAATISQLATEGVKNPDECKFTVYVPEVVILEVIEIIPCLAPAIESIEGVAEWRA